MSSINIMKLHGGEAAAILAHNHRHDGRDGVEYSNQHIDPARSHLNSEIRFHGAPRRETAAEELDRLRRRVAEIDAAEPPKRIRRDRVTMVSIEVPAPAGLPPEREEEFFRAAFVEIGRFCGGAQNCGRIQIHRDEVHEYTDPVTRERKMSRVHAHCVCIPYVAGRGVNCKAFTSRDRLRQIQQAIDSRCRRDFGIPYLDGSRQRSRGSVEDLKIASARVEAEERRLAELRQEQAQALNDLMGIHANLEGARLEAAELRDALPIVRQVARAAEILQELDSDLAEDFWAALRDEGIHPDRDQLRLQQAAQTVEDAARQHRRARHSDRGRDSGLDR